MVDGVAGKDAISKCNGILAVGGGCGSKRPQNPIAQIGQFRALVAPFGYTFLDWLFPRILHQLPTTNAKPMTIRSKGLRRTDGLCRKIAGKTSETNRQKAGTPMEYSAEKLPALGQPAIARLRLQFERPKARPRI
jgi:hypothetical protein